MPAVMRQSPCASACKLYKKGKKRRKNSLFFSLSTHSPSLSFFVSLPPSLFCCLSSPFFPILPSSINISFYLSLSLPLFLLVCLSPKLFLAHALSFYRLFLLSKFPFFFFYFLSFIPILPFFLFLPSFLNYHSLSFFFPYIFLLSLLFLFLPPIKIRVKKYPVMSLY